MYIGSSDYIVSSHALKTISNNEFCLMTHILFYDKGKKHVEDFHASVILNVLTVTKLSRFLEGEMSSE